MPVYDKAETFDKDKYKVEFDVMDRILFDDFYMDLFLLNFLLRQRRRILRILVVDRPRHVEDTTDASTNTEPIEETN
jgi:hypothetical protein